MRSIKLFLVCLLPLIALSSLAQTVTLNQKDDGFRGIWYAIGKAQEPYMFKYSGGLGTYPANHFPFSVYAAAVKKTFFCYGGASKDNTPSLLHEVAYYDHKTGMVSKPTIVLDKKTGDAHDNPVLNIDKNGFIWLFSTSHGVDRPSYIHKSLKPYDISAFEKIKATYLKNGQKVPFDNFSYLQIHYDKTQGFFGLMTHYEKGMLKYGQNKMRRSIAFITSADGVEWSEMKDVGTIQEGHYQSSFMSGNKIATSFNFHPDTEKGSGLDYRTNLYYLETMDFGKTWQNAQGADVKLPLTTVENSALVRNYQKEGLNVYINDVAFDAQNKPIIFYITSKGPEPGTENAPFTHWVAYWNSKNWQFSEVAQSDHNYDMGSIVETKKKWRILAPSVSSPQAYNTGGEMVVYESSDKGKSWIKKKQITKNSAFNHSYPRKTVNAQAGFLAIWADGHGRKVSESSMYFCNKKGNVFRLPRMMVADLESPQQVK